MADCPRLLYCNCTYAKVVPDHVKTRVLEGLAASDAAFDAVPDLCEMSAAKDPALARLAANGPVRIAACYPRAVRWLFHAAGIAFDESSAEVVNMRTESPDQVLDAMLGRSEEAAP